MEIAWWTGSREPLRALFELADDSQSQLDAYLDDGRVLVARRGDVLLGHLQLTALATPDQIEIKNMAVAEDHQGTGVGRALIEFALNACRTEGSTTMLVATGAADVGNLRFYQRLGFRMLSIERDAFTPATGYADPIMIDGIQLRDRVWLDRAL